MFGGMKDFSGGFDEMKQQFQPFSEAGTESLGTLQEQLAKMYGDPSALYAQLGAGYQQSPGFQYSVDEATKAAQRAAAAGGQLGSPAEQQALAKQVSGMASQDFGDYMNKVLGLYGGGVQGLTGLTGMGFQSAEDIANLMQAQMGLQQARELAKQQQQTSLIGDIFGLAGKAFF